MTASFKEPHSYLDSNVPGQIIEEPQSPISKCLTARDGEPCVYIGLADLRALLDQRDQALRAAAELHFKTIIPDD
uniref:hypothetical protein n=1 Tax=Pararhizobium sp. IMCC3301 TaxID=3067904 RepID=UPI002740B732|nr:hypothetical protein [Pararhizobium sp. IMCC3301]